MLDEGREEEIDRLLAPDGLVHGLRPGGPPLTGPGAFRQVFRIVREALDDLQIERTLVQGDTVDAFCRVRGPHIGHALGDAPTDRPVDFTGITIARVQNGRLVEGWNVFDFLTMYQQIGRVENPVTP